MTSFFKKIHYFITRRTMHKKNVRTTFTVMFVIVLYSIRIVFPNGDRAMMAIYHKFFIAMQTNEFMIVNSHIIVTVFFSTRNTLNNRVVKAGITHNFVPLKKFLFLILYYTIHQKQENTSSK